MLRYSRLRVTCALRTALIEASKPGSGVFPNLKIVPSVLEPAFVSPASFEVIVSDDNLHRR